MALDKLEKDSCLQSERWNQKAAIAVFNPSCEHVLQAIQAFPCSVHAPEWPLSSANSDVGVTKDFSSRWIHEYKIQKWGSTIYL